VTYSASQLNQEWAPNQADRLPDYDDFKEAAARRGRTREVSCTSDEADFEGWIRPDADLDGAFHLTCSDTGQVFKINGWLFHVEDA
jgi:hypothetical protein